MKINFFSLCKKKMATRKRKPITVYVEEEEGKETLIDPWTDEERAQFKEQQDIISQYGKFTLGALTASTRFTEISSNGKIGLNMNRENPIGYQRFVAAQTPIAGGTPYSIEIGERTATSNRKNTKRRTITSYSYYVIMDRNNVKLKVNEKTGNVQVWSKYGPAKTRTLIRRYARTLSKQADIPTLAIDTIVWTNFMGVYIPYEKQRGSNNLRLADLAEYLSAFSGEFHTVTYEPEIFSAVTIFATRSKVQDSKKLAHIFYNGKFVVTGCKNYRELYTFAVDVLNSINGYHERMGETPTPATPQEIEAANIIVGDNTVITNPRFLNFNRRQQQKIDKEEKEEKKVVPVLHVLPSMTSSSTTLQLLPPMIFPLPAINPLFEEPVVTTSADTWENPTVEDPTWNGWET